MGYQQFGISPQMVERIKQKMKNKAAKERIKNMLTDITRQELQDPAVVRRLVRNAAAVLNEKLSSAQEEQIVKFIIAQKIDPSNTFHLIRLWNMFR